MGNPNDPRWLEIMRKLLKPDVLAAMRSNYARRSTNDKVTTDENLKQNTDTEDSSGKKEIEMTENPICKENESRDSNHTENEGGGEVDKAYEQVRALRFMLASYAGRNVLDILRFEKQNQMMKRKMYFFYTSSMWSLFASIMII